MSYRGDGSNPNFSLQQPAPRVARRRRWSWRSATLRSAKCWCEYLAMARLSGVGACLRFRASASRTALFFGSRACG